jgi:hypothetical protein
MDSAITREWSFRLIATLEKTGSTAIVTDISSIIVQPLCATHSSNRAGSAAASA